MVNSRLEIKACADAVAKANNPDEIFKYIEEVSNCKMLKWLDEFVDSCLTAVHNYSEVLFDNEANNGVQITLDEFMTIYRLYEAIERISYNKCKVDSNIYCVIYVIRERFGCIRKEV